MTITDLLNDASQREAGGGRKELRECERNKVWVTDSPQTEERQEYPTPVQNHFQQVLIRLAVARRGRSQGGAGEIRGHVTDKVNHVKDSRALDGNGEVDCEEEEEIVDEVNHVSC
jgi:hypothetical protein